MCGSMMRPAASVVRNVGKGPLPCVVVLSITGRRHSASLLWMKFSLMTVIVGSLSSGPAGRHTLGVGPSGDGIPMNRCGDIPGASLISEKFLDSKYGPPALLGSRNCTMSPLHRTTRPYLELLRLVMLACRPGTWTRQSVLGGWAYCRCRSHSMRLTPRGL